MNVDLSYYFLNKHLRVGKIFRRLKMAYTYKQFEQGDP